MRSALTPPGAAAPSPPAGRRSTPPSRLQSARRRSSRRRGRSGSRAARRSPVAITPNTPAARSPSATNPPSGACRRMSSIPATAMPQATAISRNPTRMFTRTRLAWRTRPSSPEPGEAALGHRHGACHRVAPHPVIPTETRPPPDGPWSRSGVLVAALVPRLRLPAAPGRALVDRRRGGARPRSSASSRSPSGGSTPSASPRRRSWWASRRSCSSSRCWSSGSRRCTTRSTPTRVSSRGWRRSVDAVYFTVTTLSTVGFGDIHATGNGGPRAGHAPDPGEPGVPRHRRPGDGPRGGRHQVT